MTRAMGAVAQPLLVDRIVYVTIAIVTVLIVYDGWQHLKMVDVIGVIVLLVHVGSNPGRHSQEGVALG